MGLTALGMAAIAHALTGDIGTAPAYTVPFNAANTYLGVGDGTAAFVSTQYDLAAEKTAGDTTGGNSQRVLVSTAPTFSNSDTTITFTATFGTSQANWSTGWQEFGIFNGPTPTSGNGAGMMLTRDVGYIITKTSAGSVVLTVTLTIST
jgi:hypothetical protein